jgi:hypothetical protein
VNEGRTGGGHECRGIKGDAQPDAKRGRDGSLNRPPLNLARSTPPPVSPLNREAELEKSHLCPGIPARLVG